MQQDNCKHELLKQDGFWDGINPETRERTGGPRATCKNCGKIFTLTWEKWNEIPEQNREALMNKSIKE